MPAKAPAINDNVADDAVVLGGRIRAQRKALRVSATTAAQSAGMSRITWYRVEKGVPSVTMGAYLSAMKVLGLEFEVVSPAASSSASHVSDHDREGWVPVHISLAKYPQLKQLAWQVHGIDELSPREALGVYECNWRHLDLDAMEPHERQLIDALRLVFEGEGCDV